MKYDDKEAPESTTGRVDVPPAPERLVIRRAPAR